MQYVIFLFLEKHTKLSIETLSELLEGADPSYVANECNGLLYHPSFNPKRSAKLGLILSSAAEGKDITPKDTIELNPDFNPSTIKVNTVPVTVVVSYLSNRFRSKREAIRMTPTTTRRSI
jgi:hypothetical protein